MKLPCPGLPTLLCALLSSATAASSLPSSVQALRQSAFCRAYLCKPTQDAATFILGGAAFERLDWLSEVTLEVAPQKGVLRTLTLNLWNSVPGDGAKPAEIEAVFSQMRVLERAFGAAFLPPAVALEVNRRCRPGEGGSFERRYVQGAQALRVRCDTWTLTLERMN